MTKSLNANGSRILGYESRWYLPYRGAIPLSSYGYNSINHCFCFPTIQFVFQVAQCRFQIEAARNQHDRCSIAEMVTRGTLPLAPLESMYIRGNVLHSYRWWARIDSGLCWVIPGDRTGLVEWKIERCKQFGGKIKKSGTFYRGSGSNTTAIMLYIHRKQGESTAMMQYIGSLHN